MIYFVRAVGTDLVKIGHTDRDVGKRVRALQTGSAYGLELLAAFTGGPEAERALHAQFATFRAHGEWFRLPDWAVRACEAAGNFDLWSRLMEFVDEAMGVLSPDEVAFVPCAAGA